MLVTISAAISKCVWASSVRIIVHYADVHCTMSDQRLAVLVYCVHGVTLDVRWMWCVLHCNVCTMQFWTRTWCAARVLKATLCVAMVMPLLDWYSMFLLSYAWLIRFLVRSQFPTWSRKTNGQHRWSLEDYQAFCISDARSVIELRLS